LIRLIGNQKNKKTKQIYQQETPKQQQKKERPIGDPKVKGQETDDCVFFVFLFFWFFGFWKPQNQKPKKKKKKIK
jgi:hypothetical protein